MKKNKKKKKNSNMHCGIMCSGTRFQLWKAKCITNLLKLENVKVKLLIIDEEKREKRRTLLERILIVIKNTKFKNLITTFYWHFFFKPHSIKTISLSKLLSDVPRLRCKVVKKGKYSQYFKKKDLKEIQKYDLDFILVLSFGIIRGKILKIPRYGLWSFHFGDERKYRGILAAFWEIYYDDPITGCILQRLTERLDGGIVLRRGCFKTINFSYNKNREKGFVECAKWPAEVCLDIINNKADYLNNQPSTTNAPIYYSPNNVQIIVFVMKLIRNKLKRFLKNILY